jgi:UV DNA damage endonuclease
MPEIPKNFNFGYACINTELRKKNIFCSRTLRLSTLQKKGIDYAKSLAIQNLKDLHTMLKYNIDNKIFFMRISSDIFPFASHKDYSYNLDFAGELLKTIGDYAISNGIRLTAHPGPYNVLSTKDEKVLENTFRELNHNCEILDKMGLGVDSVMIIHGGGVYGDKKKSIERLKENIKKLPENTRNRLVLENCEMSYCVEDLIDVSEELQVPIVLDFHHDDIYKSTKPIEFYFDRIFKVWESRGIKPKVHVSNSVPGILESDTKTKRRKHSDLIYHLHDSLLTIKFPLDVMLEAKLKEQAIFGLRLREITDL